MVVYRKKKLWEKLCNKQTTVPRRRKCNITGDQTLNTKGVIISKSDILFSQSPWSKSFIPESAALRGPRRTSLLLMPLLSPAFSPVIEGHANRCSWSSSSRGTSLFSRGRSVADSRIEMCATMHALSSAILCFWLTRCTGSERIDCMRELSTDDDWEHLRSWVTSCWPAWYHTTCTQFPSTWPTVIVKEELESQSSISCL